PKTGAMAAAYAEGAEEADGTPSAQGRRASDGDGAWGVVPTLVLIDGGKGHLNAVQQVFLELGVTDVPLASLAKQREEIFLPHMAEPVILPRSSQGLYLVQRVRDEAHRFAITYHRQRRSKSATRSALDEAPGIGPKRKRALLRRFGSVAGIRAASLDEIAAVDGMSRASAERLMEKIGGG
ncbi:MAG: helix-hairpin-helix domain-containing protein, partial [Chloroflexota bacterium]|nr:helix-hairpin-helix domain-containing protein [Chloroflexota bacterium]